MGEYMKRALLSFAVVTGMCMPAFAADVAAPVVTPEWNWQGSYVGVFGAGSLEHFDFSEPGDPGEGGDRGSAGIGGFAGYNFQYGRIVYGVEGELGYRFRKSHFDDLSGPGKFDSSLGLFGSLKGRVGVGMGKFLPYATAGVTAARLDTFWPGGPAERDTTLFGGIVGAGVDVALTEKIFLRGEYDFSFFGKKTLEYCGGDCLLEHKHQAHDFRIGVGMKF
jgi:outer membrane immunogenic protein